MKILNALTIDVEDYFQVSNFEGVVKRTEWDKYECRVVNNTRRILDILSANNTKATFFVLGWIAERFPELVKKIDSLGHEIASHGYYHKLVYNLTRDDFKDDIRKSLEILEGITGKKVIGYRAPSCSITKDSIWAFDILKEYGIKYDSSIFPIHHDRYGIPGARRFIHKTDGGILVEFPFSTARFMGQNIPVAGGGYLRLYPYFVTKWVINKINSEGNPAMVYIHPWEIDPNQPKIKTRFLKNIRHYINIDKNEKKLTKLLRDFRFSRVMDILESKKLINL